MKTYITPALKLQGKISAVALLVMAAGILAPHSASAQEARTFNAEFKYYKSQPAEKIYGDLRRQAHEACKEDTIRPISLRLAEAHCAADLLDKAVAKLGRADVATLHQGAMAQIASR
jgi:hypothetical protein